MSKDYILSIIALLTAIINIIAVIFNTKRLEKFKKGLDVRTVRLSRLWDLRKELSIIKTEGNLDDIVQHSDEADFQDRVNNYIQSLISMYKDSVNKYLINKSFFYPTYQKEIEDNIKEYDRLQSAKTELVVTNKNGANFKEEKKEIDLKIFSTVDDGIKLIVNRLHDQIMELEKEFFE